MTPVTEVLLVRQVICSTVGSWLRAILNEYSSLQTYLPPDTSVSAWIPEESAGGAATTIHTSLCLFPVLLLCRWSRASVMSLLLDNARKCNIITPCWQRHRLHSPNRPHTVSLSPLSLSNASDLESRTSSSQKTFKTLTKSQLGAPLTFLSIPAEHICKHSYSCPYKLCFCNRNATKLTTEGQMDSCGHFSAVSLWTRIS